MYKYLRQISLIVLLSAICANGQKLSLNKSYSQFNYVFKLDSTQMRQAFMGTKLDSSLFLTHLVDSFNRDSVYKYDKLPYGLYFIISVNNYVVTYQSYHNRPFIIEPWGTNKRNFITLKDKNNLLISQAKISLLNDSVCKFIAGMGAYLLPELKKSKLVKIEYNGQYDYIFINTMYASTPKIENDYPDQSYTTIAPGYLVFNQPKFKYYDTLKWKAYLLYDDGRAFTQKLKLYLSVDYKEKFIGYMKPITPGAYFSQFEIADTFLVDKQYTLILKNLSNETVKSNTFTIENYELKANKYNIFPPKSQCIIGDKVALTISALDANNLPVMDATISINLRITSISQYLKDRQFIPDAWMQSYCQLELPTDVSGYTNITFPDSLFANFNASYEIKITIKDLDNNVKEMWANFNYTNNDKSYAMHYKDDSLHIQYFLKTYPAKTNLVLETYIGGKSSKKNITTPYSEPINYQATHYNLYRGDTAIYYYQAPANYTDLVYFNGERTGDSIHIDLVNPLNLTIYYELYNNTKKIGEGSGTQFHLHTLAPGSNSYHVVWGHNYSGKIVSSFKVKSFHFSEKKLNVSMNQPTEIYPGQTIDLAIKITNQFNLGVENVNLTAYSVNSQFDNIPAPDVPYLGLIRGGYPLQFVYPVSYTPHFSTSFVLQKYHFDVLNLFKNEYYQLLYAKTGIGIIKTPIKRQKSELSVYVIKQHQLQNIVYIKIDNQLVYHQFYLTPKAFSFPIKKGEHTISIRTFDNLLTYNNLLIKDSSKYTLGYNLDSIKHKPDTLLYAVGKLKNYEREEFLDNALFISIKNFRDTFSVYQNKQLIAFSTLIGPDYSNSLSTLRMENDNYICIGPIAQDEVNFKLYRQFEHQFIIEKGKAYLLYENEVKPISITSNLKQYGLLSNVITNAGIYNLQNFDKLWYSPIYDTLIKKPLIPTIDDKKLKQERERPYIQQKTFLPEKIYGRSVGHLMFVYPPNKTQLFQNAWLINKTDSSYSVINNQQRDMVSYYQSNPYDLLLFTDSSYCLVQNLDLKTAGRHVFFLKTEDFKPLDYAVIYPYEKIINELTKLPFTPFTDAPYIIKPYVLEKRKYNSIMAKVSGTVLDAKFNTPIDYTNIYAEIDGYFKAGATTNADGKFELNNIPPGNYMLKIRSNDYRYQIIYNLKIEAGKELIIKINLLHRNDEIYYNSEGEIVMNESIEPYYKDGYSSNTPPSVQYENEVVRKSGFRSFNDVAGLSAGVTTSSYALSGRGSRDDGTVYFIDGVRTLKSADNAPMAFKEKQIGTSEFETNQAMQNKLDAMANIAQANRVRDKFRDYGYWIPNLITDKYGMAYCTVTFPDNITAWQTFVPAMNAKLQTGLHSMTTRAFKPLVAQMAVPFFLTEGDAILLKGKVLNYTGTSKNINLQFLINDSLIKNKDITVEQLMADSLLLKAIKGQDSVSTTFMMKLTNGYKDGEKRSIPIRPNSIIISNSENIYLNKDSTYKIYIPKDIKSAKILVHNSEVERLLEEIKVLKNYSYGCVEQTTSKLRALLTEKAICQTLNMPFKEDKMVRKMIHKLTSLRSQNGTWSWWGNGYEDDYLTAYVMRTLNEARLAGYANNAYIKGANFMEKKLDQMTIENKLYTLNMLKDMNREVEYDTILKHINPQPLNVNSKLLYTRLQQKLGHPYQITDITQHLQYSTNGGIFFGTNTYNYKNDMASSTLLAYDILSQNDTGKEYLPYIKQYFYSSGFPRHTFALAEMITAGTKDAIVKSKTGNAITGEIQVNDYNLKAADFPFKNNLRLGDTVTIKHKGPIAYATLITSRAETNPQGNNNNFTIKTTLANLANNINLKPGVPVTLQIEVEAFKSFENVMIEVPIPAGFSYYNKAQGSGSETYREYYYDKTSIFCTYLSAGKYYFNIQLVPKFSGTIHLPPAKVELMYYPEIFNNEAPKVIQVE